MVQLAKSAEPHDEQKPNCPVHERDDNFYAGYVQPKAYKLIDTPWECFVKLIFRHVVKGDRLK